MWVKDYTYSDMSMFIDGDGDIAFGMAPYGGYWYYGDYYDESIDCFFFLDNCIIVYTYDEPKCGDPEYGRFSYDPNFKGETQYGI